MIILLKLLILVSSNVAQHKIKAQETHDHLGELHLVHALASVPVKEGLAAEHGGELLRDPLEQLLLMRIISKLNNFVYRNNQNVAGFPTWMAVELPMKVADILRPLGGMSQTAVLMLFGILNISSASRPQKCTVA